jgi:hypothetical protein
MATNSLWKTARLAGLFWLLNAATTAFSLQYVRPRLIVWTDAAATVSNLMANEYLFRMGVVSNLFSQIFLFLFGLTAFRLFKRVDKTWATIFLASVLLTVAIAVVNSLNNVAALVVLSKADYLNAFSQEQLNAMALMFLRLNNHGQGVLEIFWCPYLFALGLLIIKSRFIPRILGIPLIIGSFGFPIYTFSRLLTPQFPPAVFIQIIGFIIALGTVPTIFWFLIKGVKEQPQSSKA